MADFNEEAEIQRLIKGAYRTVTPPAQLKSRLQECIILEASVAAGPHQASLWERPKVWLPIAIGAVAAVIGYGAWLSINVTQSLLR